MKRSFIYLCVAAGLATSCNNSEPAKNDSDNIAKTRRLEGEELVKRGEYLMLTGACDDCHSPKNFTAEGPVPDESKRFSGHPGTVPSPPIDTAALRPGYWVLMAPDITSFVGPWGISYAANLTADSATGIGTWSEAMFINTLRKGKHMGEDNGRALMPPMPWQFIGKMTDDDLRAMYAYLRSLPAINNKVPAPVPPNMVGK